jgi:MHS family alpha-ketoglutarate permease-like MFS transporter
LADASLLHYLWIYLVVVCVAGVVIYVRMPETRGKTLD